MLVPQSETFVSWSRIFQPWCIWVLHGETNGCFFNLFAKCLLGNKKLSVIFVSLVFYFDIYVPFMNFVSFLQIGSLLFLSALGVFPVSCVFFHEIFLLCGCYLLLFVHFSFTSFCANHFV